MNKVYLNEVIVYQSQVQKQVRIKGVLNTDEMKDFEISGNFTADKEDKECLVELIDSIAEGFKELKNDVINGSIYKVGTILEVA